MSVNRLIAPVLCVGVMLAMIPCQVFANADYEAWKAQKFTSAQIAAGQAAENVDFDDDGLPNLVEYAFGLEPRTISDRSRLPKVTALSGSNLSLEYERISAVTSDQVEFETSPDLINWTTADAGSDYTEQSLGVTASGTQAYRVTFNGISSAAAFVRAKIYLDSNPGSATSNSIVINEIRYSSASLSEAAPLEDRGVDIVGISWEDFIWQAGSREYLRGNLLDGLATTEWRVESSFRNNGDPIANEWYTYGSVDYKLPLHTTINEFHFRTGFRGRPKDIEIYVGDTYPEVNGVIKQLKFADTSWGTRVIAQALPNTEGVLKVQLPPNTQGRYIRIRMLNTHDEMPLLLEDSNMKFGIPSFGEYVELYNKGTETVNLANWRLSGEIDYVFPAGATMAPGSYLVVASDPTNPNYASAPLGPFTGGISSDSGTINLRDPADMKVDSVNYKLGFPWPVAKGNGGSIELINPDLENDRGGNWRSSIDWANGEEYGRPTPGAQNLVYSTSQPPMLSKVDHSPKEPTSSDDVVITVKVEDPDGVKKVILHYQLVDVTGDNYIRARDPAFTTWYNKSTASDATDLIMKDDGSGSDQVSGDGIYTVTIPSSVHDRQEIVRYRITAEDNGGDKISIPYKDDGVLNFAYHCYDGVPDYTAESYATGYAGKTYSSESLSQLPVYNFYCRKHPDKEYPNIVKSERRSGAFALDGYQMIAGREYATIHGQDRNYYYGQGTMVYEGKVYDHVKFRMRGETSTYSHGYKNKWKIKFNNSQPFEARDMYGKKYKNPWRVMNILNGHSRSHQTLEDTSRVGSLGAYFNQPASFMLAGLLGLDVPSTHYFHLRMNFDWKDQHQDDMYMGPFMGVFVAIQQHDNTFIDDNDMPEGNIYNIKYMPEASGRRYHTDGFYDDGTDFKELLTTIIDSWNDRNGIIPIDINWIDQHIDMDSFINWTIMNCAINNTDLRPLGNVVYFNNKETGKWECLPWDLNLTFDADYNPFLGLRDMATRDLFNPIFAAKPEYKLAFNNRAREVVSLLLENGDFDILIDSLHYCLDHGMPDPISEADRAVWDYNPFTHDYGTEHWHRGSYFNFKGGGRTMDSMKATIKSFVRRGNYGGDELEDYDHRDDTGIPSKPTISYTGSANYPTDELSFNCGNFSGSGFGAMKWRVAEVTDPTAPDFDISKKPKYEMNATWESAEITSFSNSIDIPTGVLKVDRTYRARVRMKDSSGRWSYWSNPIQFRTSMPSSRVYVNEIMAHTDKPDRDAIELYNPTSVEIDLTGWTLSDGKGLTNGVWTIPAGHTIPAGGYKVFYEGSGYSGETLQIGADNFGNAFSLSAIGDGAYVTSPDQSFQHGFAFDATYNGTTIGRYINSVGKEVDTELESRSLGAANGNPLIGDVVISEIMYQPNENVDDHEFVEITNRKSSSVNLFSNNGDSWKVEGIGFFFPPNTVLQGDETVVLVRDTITLSDFRQKHGLAQSVRLFSYDGGLNNGGETIKLMAPDEPVLSGNNVGEVGYVVIDKVDYNDKEPWPLNADGLGKSLVRTVLNSFGDDAGSWSESATDGGTPGSVVPVTDPLLAISKTTISVSATEGENAAPASFTVWNAGVNTLSYTISEQSSRFSVSPTSGTSTGPSDKNTHTITFNTSGLSVGEQAARTITVSDGVDSYDIDVIITITAQPAAPTAPVNLPLTVDMNNSTGGTLGTSAANTLTDGFSYDPEDPTSALPKQSWDAGTAYAVDISEGTDAKVTYTINGGAVTLSAGQTLVVDIYGRASFSARSQNIDVELYRNGTFVDSVTGLGISVAAPYHVRASLNPTAAFDTIVVVGHDSAETGNKFQFVELRAAK